MEPVGTMLSEEFEVNEQWMLSDVWLKVSISLFLFLLFFFLGLSFILFYFLLFLPPAYRAIFVVDDSFDCIFTLMNSTRISKSQTVSLRWFYVLIGGV